LGDQLKIEMGGAWSAYGESRGVYRSLVAKPEGKRPLGRARLKERDHLEEPGVDGRKTARWIFRKWDVGAWTGSIGFRKGTGVGHLPLIINPRLS